MSYVLGYLWAMLSFPIAIYFATENGWAAVASISLLVFIAATGENIERKIK